jgi:hypothetical protein
MEDRELVYSETFVKTTYNPQYVIQEMYKLYTPELGWEIGEPEIIDLGNGTYKLSVPLKKYKVEEQKFGGIR